ncbi:MAG TPA: IclR family transcriptional regulator [Propionibacteriaceae bacterium]
MSDGVQTIERAAAIMRLLAESDCELALTQIAGSLGLAKATAHGLLKTLTEVGLVIKDPVSTRYGPARDFWTTAATPVDPNQLRGSALNFADSLASRTGEAVRVGVLEGVLVRVVHHVFAPGQVSDRLDVDATYLAHACALGKVLLAHRAGAAIRLGRAELGASTGRTLVDGRALERELATVRLRGWASDEEELNRYEAGIAAPVRTSGGLVIGAIGITGSVDRLLGRDPRRTEQLAREVCQAARSISAGMGSGL